MKTNVGLWIDHRKAIIVFLTGKEKAIKLVSSNIEQPRRKSGIAMRADNIDQRVLTEHLNNYYDEVITCLGNVETILIMGNGEAKGELKKRIETNNHQECKINVETVDKMTDNQIVAKIRKYFVKRKSVKQG